MQNEKLTTTENITAALPPTVHGITGCEAYNKKRDELQGGMTYAIQKFDRAVARLPSGISRERFDAENARDDALQKLGKELAALKREYAALLCIPTEGAAPAVEIAWNLAKLMAPGDSQEARKFNRKVADFSDRRMTALRDLQHRASEASNAYAMAQIENKATTDAELRARNKAAVALAAASKPFIQEFETLKAARQRFNK